MSIRKTRCLIAAVVAILSIAFFSPPGFSAAGLRQVANSEVCMVTNRAPGRDMIPVHAEGKTYYGCCQVCVTKLKANPAVRFSPDPLTGRMVDKAAAFILAAEDGSVLYFESKESAEKYISGPGRKRI